jgi:hypothetical protein
MNTSSESKSLNGECVLFHAGMHKIVPHHHLGRKTVESPCGVVASLVSARRTAGATIWEGERESRQSVDHVETQSLFHPDSADDTHEHVGKLATYARIGETVPYFLSGTLCYAQKHILPIIVCAPMLFAPIFMLGFSYYLCHAPSHFMCRPLSWRCTC